MSLWKKILIGFVALILLVVVSFVAFIGPWPTYKDSKFESSAYYKKALEDIDAAAKLSEFSKSPGQLQAGWASSLCTPPIGTPLGGYGARKGAPSTGVHDDLYVKALVLSDGKDMVAITGSDLLLVPPNVAAICRERVAKETPLTEKNILFTASHTHCGPGGWAPGIAGYVTGGKYDPKIPELLGNAFATAIIDAYHKMKPAQIAHGVVDATQYIRNRARDAAVDPELNFAVVKQDEKNVCYAVRFSAHPTNYDDDMMQFSAEYPGVIQRTIEQATGGFSMYLGGSLGSSSPRAPEGPNADARIDALGKALAQLVLDNSQNLTFESNPDIVSLGVPLGMPPFQMRPLEKNPGLRVSPFVAKIFGVPPEGWIQGVRVGKLLFVGVPFDLSGEISIEWKQWAKRRDLDAWPTGFCAAYCGYLSPDKYYNVTPLGYETALMSWFGPNNEAYFTALVHHVAEALTPATQQAALSQ